MHLCVTYKVEPAVNEYSDCVRVGVPTPFPCVRVHNRSTFV